MLARATSTFTRLTALAVTAVLLTFTSPLVRASEVAVEGAAVGKWTQDFAAASKLASEKDLPILMNFTGSDWCGWCKLMDGDVFAKEEWTTFAKDNLVLVTIDFPQDETIVPEAFKARNQKLQAQFGIEGYPTYVILDSDGTTELGRLSAGKGKTPASFQREIEGTTKYREANMKPILALMSEEDRASFLGARAAQKSAMAAIDAFIAQQPPRTDENVATFNALQDAVDKADTELMKAELLFRETEVKAHAKELDAEESAAYLAAFSNWKTTTAELNTWLETRPERTEENTAKFMGYQTKIDAAETELAKYE